jgi:hypothetical protein
VQPATTNKEVLREAHTFGYVGGGPYGGDDGGYGDASVCLSQ